MSNITTAKDYFDTLGDRFNSDAAKGLTATFQFELSGDEGGTYCVHVDDGAMSVCEGAEDEPTFVLKMKADDYIKMAHGKLNGAMAFMTGKMKISGNRSLAPKMKEIFPLIKD